MLEKSKEIIKSVSEDQVEILERVRGLYCPEGYDCDVTFSKGNFYPNGRNEPKWKFDINPLRDDVKKADCRALPLDSASLQSIVFDPPFLHQAGSVSIIGNRFSYFRTQHELRAFYLSSLVEIFRVLKPHGILVFKCQDIVESGKQVMNHCLVWQLANMLGFIDKDLFILIAKSRMIGGNHAKQYHARKFHSYFWVFEKGQRR